MKKNIAIIILSLLVINLALFAQFQSHLLQQHEASIVSMTNASLAQVQKPEEPAKLPTPTITYISTDLHEGIIGMVNLGVMIGYKAGTGHESYEIATNCADSMVETILSNFQTNQLQQYHK